MSHNSALELLDPDARVGDYQIITDIGYGAFGAVYHARHLPTKREVAIKETLDPQSTDAFKGEFAILHQLDSAHLPHYYAMFEHDDKGYLVMEFIPGQSLFDVLERRQWQPLLESVVLGYAGQLCDVLTYLHTQTPPLIHRDIKPANIRLTPDGLITLVDFGLVKQGLGGTGTTRRGLTPAYAPLEQWGSMGGVGVHTSPQSDLYSLAASFYHLLTGQVPPTAMDRIAATPDCLLPPSHYNPKLSPHVSNALMQAMAIFQANRIADAATFKRALLTPAGASPPQPGLVTQPTVAAPTLRVTPQPEPEEERVVSRINPLYPITIAEWRNELAQRNKRFGQPNGYWCYVRPGDYAIGGWEPNDPVATITLNGFWIAKYPITVQQYRQFQEGGYDQDHYWTTNGWAWRQAKKRTQPWRWGDERFMGNSQPVIGVTWYEATAFAKWLTSVLANSLPQGASIRLPTEAEWEAAAGYDVNGHRTPYPWGKEMPTRERAVFNDNSKSKPQAPFPVGERPAGAAGCGAQDMVGSVWEPTCSSHAGYPAKSQQVVADFSTSSSDVPYRGGSWYNNVDIIRCAARDWLDPGYDGDDYEGFRLVLLP